MWYCLSANGAGTVTITATFSGSATAIQLAAAEYPIGFAILNITAASQASGQTTYTCTVTEGFTLVAKMQVIVTGMADAGNNNGGSNPASFLMVSTNGSTSFVVQNNNGVTRAVQTGTGVVAQPQGGAATVDVELHAATGSSTTPSSGALIPNFGNELWIGYADVGSSSSWSAGSNYTMRSTTALRRAAIEDNFNTSAYVAAAAFTTSNLAWEAGVICFRLISTGLAPTQPTSEVSVAQGVFAVVVSPRFSPNTDPYGATGSGSGTKVGQIYPTGRN